MHYTIQKRQRFASWVDEGCPGITFIEASQGELQVSAAQMLRQMQDCTDVLPSALGDAIGRRLGFKSSLRGRSYGEAARRMLAAGATATRSGHPSPKK